MSGINTGKVITGGLLAGVIYNACDFVNNYLLVGEDFRANATRLGLDPAAAESPAGIATWVIIDLLLGIVVVWTYAAMRPRFGAGPRTAIYAGLVPFISISLVTFGMSQVGLMPTALWMKVTVASLFITSIGAVAGAWLYKET